MIQTYTIYGDPIPLARPRFAHRKVWDEQKQIKHGIRLDLEQQHNGQPLFKGPLEFRIQFNFRIPSSISKKRRETIHEELHAHRPDLSNLIKFYEDCGNGILYNDDSSIAVIIAKKGFSEEPSTTFTIVELL